MPFISYMYIKAEHLKECRRNIFLFTYFQKEKTMYGVDRADEAASKIIVLLILIFTFLKWYSTLMKEKKI